jgi:hypothetical protein
VSHFRQLKEPGWPNAPTRTLGVLALEPSELEERLGLVFADEQDDLDDVSIAVLELPDTGRVFGLLRYRHSPSPGTEVHGYATPTAPKTDLIELLRALSLKPRDVRTAWDGERWTDSTLLDR